MISNIHEYDVHPLRKRRETLLILSVDEKFKNKIKDLNLNSLCLGFSENSIDDIQDFAAYFKFFLSVLVEVDKVIIDGDFYSQAVGVIHSASLNLKNIKEVIVYADERNTEDVSFYSRDVSLSSVTNHKEKTYSRREFFDSRCI